MVFKGIIIEIKDKYSIVMNDNGSMVRVKNKEGLKVGDGILFLEEDIYIKNNVINFADFKAWKPMVAIAACLMLVLIFAYNRNPYTDYALLSMDVNPSIQFKLDKDGTIIDILGLNEDGEKILDKHLIGKPLEEGLSTLKFLMEENNYLKHDSPILVGFAYLEDIKDDKYEENIKGLLKKVYSKNEILYLKSNFLKANESLKNKLSLGRIEALESMTDENLKANIGSISVKEIKDNISKSNRIEIFNYEDEDDIDDEIDEDDDEDDSDEKDDDDSDYENDEDDNNDKLEDKIDKQNNKKDNDEIDDEKDDEKEKKDEENENDSSTNTSTLINKELNDDNIKSNKSNSDYEDETNENSLSNDSKNGSSDNNDSRSNTNNSSEDDSND